MKRLIILTCTALLLGSCSEKVDDQPENQVQYLVNDWEKDDPNGVKMKYFDLDANGDVDFEHLHHGISDSSWCEDHLYLDVYNKHRLTTYYDVVKLALFSDNMSTPFKVGDPIDELLNWTQNIEMYEVGYQINHGVFQPEVSFAPFESNNGNGYIAVRYQKGEDIYYGWIRLNIDEEKIRFKKAVMSQTANASVKIGDGQ